MGILELLKAVGKGAVKQDDAAKKIAEMGYPESVAKRIASGELPMDEASRAARRDAFGVRTVHGTGDPQSLTEVDPNLVDIGLHSGTPQQANTRLNDVYKARNFVDMAPRNTFEDGSGILPLVVKEGKQLKMEDVGDWMNSMQVMEGMISNPAFRKYKNQLEDMYDEAGNIASQFDGGEELFRDSPENREFLDELRAMITDEGYDSIKYKNQVENIYGSDAGYSPEGEAARKELFDELKSIENNAYMSRPNPPNPNDPNLSDKLDAYLSWKPNYTEGERIRQDEIRKLLAEIEADPKFKNDPNSIISLNPSNVRSEFAAFDPEYTGSNILGALSMLGIGYLGSSALGMMSPEEKLFAAPAQRQPEMRAIGGSDTEAQAATRNAAQTLGELLLSGDSPEITSTRGAGETMMKIANNQPIGIMDALEVAGQVDPMQVPALIKALYNYSRQQ
jgi:hypothetical protein